MLVLVARQNGKTEVPVILCAYWLFVDAFPMVLGTSTTVTYAKESWTKFVKLTEATADLADLHAKNWTRLAAGEVEAWTTEGSRYKIATSNEEGGRSLTINRLVLDELRQHHDYSAWNAAEPATSAVWGPQIWALSNAGDDRSVVLNDLRDAALAYIETGEGDSSIGLFEWSAPETADPRDIRALAQANPNLNRRVPGDALLAKAKTAVAKGGEVLNSFKTEYMCIRVKQLDPAVDPDAWGRGQQIGDLLGARSRVAAFLDVAPDQLHATLCAAAMFPGERVRVEPVAAWEGAACTEQLRRDLPGLLARVRPRVLGWLPNGPAAALAADLKVRPGWPPKGITVEEIRAELPSLCMGFAEHVIAGRIVHPGDPLINDHVLGAQKLPRGDAWVFSRKGEGHCDAAYAAAGAVHLARTMPPPIGKPRLVTVPD